MRKSCCGRFHGLQSPRFRRGFPDLPDRPIDHRDATNESTPILATAKDMTIVKFLNFPKTPFLLFGTSGHFPYIHDFADLHGCMSEDLLFAMEDLPIDLGRQSRHLEGVMAFGRVV